MKYIYLYMITFAIFLAIDFVWLNFIAKNIYSTRIGHLLAENPKLFPALIFYLIFVIGIIIFAVIPGYEERNIWKTIIFGALFGLLTYSTYDLTNLATLKGWPISVTVIDLIWGTSISTLTSVLGYLIATLLRV